MFNDEFIVVMPPKHALAEVKHITVNDIVEYPFVSMNSGSTMRKWVDERLATSSARIRIAGEASQFSTIGNLVYSGMGIAIVPAMVEQQMRSKGCISAVVDDLKIIKRVGMITAKNKGLSSVAQAFIKNLKLEI
jgi:LysR family carnitine catabolism transcriptional activator